MIISSIIRNLKIDIILEEPNRILDSFNSFWERITVNHINKKTYGKQAICTATYSGIHQYIFVHVKENNEFLCSYTHYWQIFQRRFELSYSELQVITIILLENKLDIKISIVNGSNLSDLMPYI